MVLQPIECPIVGIYRIEAVVESCEEVFGIRAGSDQDVSLTGPTAAVILHELNVMELTIRIIAGSFKDVHEVLAALCHIFHLPSSCWCIRHHIHHNHHGADLQPSQASLNISW